MTRTDSILIADLDPRVVELGDEELELAVGGELKPEPPDSTGYLCTATSQGGTSEDCWRA